ncbi:MAG: diadenylate cyclase CdaA [Verrucomicrobiota bacterium]|nr:diadenylate cyclase CdaA [Verrucomicrobiota bacterium]MEE2813015.1 diadenylate cyclase CdaA [Verrucomicrobiota bacterium]
MDSFHFILATEIPQVSDIPEWINTLWEWIKLDWVWIVRAIVEISALAVGIYYAFTFLQRSRGWPVVLGFLILIGLTTLIALLELQVLRWLLQQLFLFTTVAILIIFQPELRRLLAELGNLPIFSSDEDSPLDVDAVVQATNQLSRKRVGSIVAIERTVDIYQETNSGVLIDCALTPEMLDSIFFPNSQLHDGGVVVRGDRIMYASCIFPLTRRIDINNTLGTRHRAAIGLSEETDAIVVIVSEETGDISYSHNGALYRKVSLKQLKDFLTEMLKVSTPSADTQMTRSSRLRESFRELIAIIEKKIRPKPSIK